MKNKRKIFATLNLYFKWLVVTMLIFTSITLPVNAEERTKGGYGGEWTGPVPYVNDGVLDVDTSVGWSLGGSSYGQEGLMTINGEVVYCLERQKSYYSGMAYVGIENDFSSAGIDPDTKIKLSLIAYFGKQRAIKDNNPDWHAIVGSAIWAELGEGRGWIESPSFPDEASVKAGIQALQNDVANYYILPSFENGNYTVKVGETIRLTDSNGVLSTFKINSTDGLTAEIDGNDLVITGTAEASDTSIITFKKNISSADTGASILYDAGEGVQKIGSFRVYDPNGGNVTLDVEKYGSLQLAKQDNKGSKVANTSFDISYNSDMSDKIGNYTTGNDGTVTVDNLLPQDVYIQETNVPSHLILDDTIHKTTIIPNDTVTYTATNDWKQGYIQVTKKDEATGKVVKIAGTTFEIYNSKNVLVTTITTNANGIAKTGLLDYNQYYVKEKNAPKGYLVNLNKSETVNVNIDGKTYDVTISDTPVKGKVNLSKVDKETGTAQGNATLQGAKYGLYANKDIKDPSNDGTVLYKAGTKIAELTTDDKGQASKDNLYLGDYYIKEISPSNGYLIDTAKYEFSLTYANQNTAVVTQTVTSKEQIAKGKLDITKFGSDGGSGVVDGLAGIEFTIKLQSEVATKGWDLAKTYDVLVTNAFGKDTSIDLPFGLYIVRETKTKPDYAPSGDFLVNIDQDGEIEYRLVNNAPFKSQLKIIKTDIEGNAVTLSNATFKLKDSAGNIIKQKVGGKYIEEFKTDENGVAQLPLALSPDTYTIIELTTPDGFLIGKDIKVEISAVNPDVELDEDNEPIITVTFKNDKPTGKIILKKVFENIEDTAVGGATFKLTANQDIINSTNGDILYKEGDPIDFENTDGLYTINELGSLEISNLPLGQVGASYKLEEISTIDGYKLLDQPIIFDFDIQDNTTKEYVIQKTAENKLTETHFSKTDILGKELIGAELRLIDSDYNIIDEWISSDQEHTVKGLVYGKEYTLIEDLAPLGYSIANSITFVYSEDIKKVTMIDTMVIVKKLNIHNQPVIGATLQVINTKTKQIVDEWITNGTDHHVNNLLTGETYILQEIKTPDSFITAKPIEFTVSASENQDIIMLDQQMSVNKIDENGQSLSGATLQIIDQENNIVDEWITNGTPYNPNGLIEGQKYTLREAAAPNGFILAKDIQFTAGEENSLTITMTDKQVSVLKVDQKGNPLSGATLQIIDQENNVIDEWITNGTPYNPTGLIEGQKYTLRELEAPEGFMLAEDIQFTAGEENSLTITMIDNQVSILKVDQKGNPLSGATLQIINTKTRQIVDQWTSGDYPYNPNNLINGQEYILKELEAPEGFMLAEDIRFIAGQDLTITMTDNQILTDIQVNKVDSETKEAIKSLDFEFTMYADEQCTQPIAVINADQETGTATFKNVDYGTVYIKETKAPKGYELSSEIKKIVIDDDLEGVGEVHSFVYENTLLPAMTIVVRTSDDTSAVELMACMGLGLIGIFLFTKKKIRC